MQSAFENMVEEVKACTICAKHLPLGPRPVIRIAPSSKVLIVGQAPGTKVHASGIPWDDASGMQLRKWMGLSDEQFYDSSKIAIVPMAFCYPGKGKSGDLPPRPECAPQWHETLLKMMPNIRLTLLIGQYAQKYYLQDKVCRTLTETVKNYKQFLPSYLVLPHPSPRNRFWMSKNPWFEEEVVPELRERVSSILT